MTYKKIILTSVLLCMLFSYSMGSSEPDSTQRAAFKAVPVEEVLVTRTFAQLNTTVSNSSSDPITVPYIVLDDSATYYREKANELHEKVVQRNAMVTSFMEASKMEMPVGIAAPNGDHNYTIIISKIRANAKIAYIDAYMMLEIPGTGDKIAFKGKNIEFSHDGGFTGAGKLELIGDYGIKLSDKTMAYLLGKGNTFVEFDCNGYKGMGVEAEIQFSRDMIIPEDEQGNLKAEPERVKTRFATYAQSWNDLMVGVNLPPFQVNGLKGFGFSVQEAFLDWSDLANPPSLLFPPGYTSPFIEAGSPLLWQGIYMQRLEILLPKSFKQKDNPEQRIKVGVQNMLLDDQGFSGIAFIEDQIIKAGDMSGWSFSLDKIALELVTNQVKGFELGGKLAIPVVKDKEGKMTQFAYRAHRGADSNYIFAVTVQSNLKLPMFMADLTLYQGSSITIKEKEDRFYPTAMLNGELGIKGTEKGPKPELLGIRFEGMRISSEEPRFDIQAVGFGREGQQQQVSKYPVVINNIMVRKEAERFGLDFDLTINIGGKPEDDGFGGTAGLTVWAKRGEVGIKDAEGAVIGTEKNGLKYDKVELSAIAIRVKKAGAFEMNGTVRYFDEDVTYGEGFRGDIKGSIGKVGDGAQFQLYALFGKTPTYRYWYADALVDLQPGIPLIPGVLDANGFGGGYYHRMKQSDVSIASTLGKAPSGITYLPEEKSRGVRAVMNIATPRPELFNGTVALEVVMNNSGGINTVTMTGLAKFLDFQKMGIDKMKEYSSDAATGKLATKLASVASGQMYANMRLHFDNVNDVFHGNMEMYANVAAGMMRGVGPGNKAGWAVLHFEKSDWYVHIGTPDQPLGMEMARIFKSKAYMMAGKNLPGSPAPPSQVVELLGGKDMDYMRDMNALQSGTGMAFGLNFIVDTGDLKFLMFYGRFAAGAGLDIMLKDYGTGYHCAGDTGPMGINGWYANGQAYAFVKGKIGIKVNLKFYKGNYDILDIGAAAIMQVKAPNPFWMQGSVGGHYRILGGLVKGHCKFDVTVGKDCKPVGEQNLFSDVNMIAEISPAKGTTEVDVFNTPQVAFNIPVGEIFDITDIENKRHVFRAVLDEFTIKDGSNQITGSLQWNSSNDVVIFDGHEILPGEKKLTAKARLSFEEMTNGVWTKVKFDGKVVEEIVETAFETAKAPDYIPTHNVAVSYPVRGQVNFYPAEYNQGFIQLKDGQAYLFQPGDEWIQKIRMTEAIGGKYLEADLTYNTSQKRVDFNMPSGFTNKLVYNFEILNIPRQSKVIDANVQKVETELMVGSTSEDAKAVLTTKDIEGDLTRLEIKPIYSSNFRTSKYNTFVEKMGGVKISKQCYNFAIESNVFRLTSLMNGEELFDDTELFDNEQVSKAIVVEAILHDNAWYTTYIYPLLYEGYPFESSIVVKTREIQELGLPPVRDIYFSMFNSNPPLNVGENTYKASLTGFERLNYNIANSVHIDYLDILRGTANYVVDNPGRLTKRMSNLLLLPEPKLRYGPYRIRFNYFIPGMKTPNSNYEFELFNPIPDNENN